MAEISSELPALAYHEPEITTILVLSSFLLLLNIVNSVVDRLLYVGLLGEILIGIAFGTPGARWLQPAAEALVSNLGYLGLILLVYEGGISTSYRALKANLVLSLAVAATGIVLPIGLSFVLCSLVDASPLQSFTAGAALCSTSLGTTFTVLQTSGLSTTRIGVVLTSAAMIDDVVGIVMVQVVANLSPGAGQLDAVVIVRPIFVALALAIVALLMCRFCLLPIGKILNTWKEKSPEKLCCRVLLKVETSLLVHLAILVSSVTGASYAGTSVLFATYLTGAAISWWDSEVSRPKLATPPIRNDDTSISGENCTPDRLQTDIHAALNNSNNKPTMPGMQAQKEDEVVNQREQPSAHLAKSQNSGLNTFETYLSQPLNRILKPFFFASIGFSIPITRMFQGSIIWRGIIYTMLMFVGKIACGLWLVKFAEPRAWAKLWSRGTDVKDQNERIASQQPANSDATSDKKAGEESNPTASFAASDPTNKPQASSQTTEAPRKPVSVYPAVILGSAMVARGEIGFLISSIADASGIFGEAQGPMFLIVTWAIVLCTILGPVCVGITVRRLRKLESEKGASGRADVLGGWGVN